MSNNQEWFDEVDDEFEDDFEESAPQRRSSGEDVVKKLRRQERAQAKRIKELETELVSFRKSQRDSIVRTALEAKGLSPKVAAFVPQDVDVESSAFDSWLNDYADVFGGSAKAEAPSQPSTQLTQEQIAALRQVDAVTTGTVTPDAAADMLQRIENASSPDDIMNMIYGAN